MASSGFTITLWSLLWILVLTTSSGNSNNLQHEVVLRAQCQCFCLFQFGRSATDSANLYDFYQPQLICSKEDFDCSQCLTQCRNTEEGLEQCQQLCTTEACFSSCDFINKWQQLYLQSQEPPTASLVAQVGEPRVHCQTVYAQWPNEVRLYVRWTVDSRDAASSHYEALAFVVDVRARNEHEQTTHWNSFPSVYGMVPVVVNASTWYQFRVTPVLYDGIAGYPKLTQWTKSLPSAFRSPGPASIQIDRQVVKNKLVHIIFSWKPPLDGNVCHYKLLLLPDSNLLPAIEHRIDVLPDFVYEFGPLEYDTRYEVHLAACTAEYLCSSEVASAQVHTLTCLQATDNDYTACPPAEVTNVTFTVLEERKNPNGSDPLCFATYEVIWSTPRGVVNDKHLFRYELTWEEESRVRDEGANDLEPETINTFSTNATLLSFEVRSDRVIRLRIVAESLAGKSPATVAYIHPSALSEKCQKTEHSFVSSRQFMGESGERLALYIAVPIIIVFVALLILWAYKSQRLCFSFFVKFANDSSESKRNPLYHIVQKIDKEDELAESGAERRKDEYEIALQDLTFGDLLGQGAFGKVVKGNLHLGPGWMANQQQSFPMTVAVKTTKEFASDEDRNSLLEEIGLMKKLGRHTNIVSLVACVTQLPGSLCLVMDYCHHGDLRSYLRRIREKLYPTLNFVVRDRHTYSAYSSHDSSISRENRIDDCAMEISEGISESLLLSYARQIATGMEYLAQRKFVHRDLAARNILVCDSNLVKISDFGLTRDVYEDSLYQKCTTGKVPIKWMSIEAIFDQVYTTQSDVWSFGVVLWEIIMMGGTPYPGINNNELFNMLKEGYRMPRPNNCSEKMYEIMRACWSTSPLSRPTFSALRVSLDNMLEQCLEQSDAYLSFEVDGSAELDMLMKDVDEEDTSAKKNESYLTNSKNKNSGDTDLSESKDIISQSKCSQHATAETQWPFRKPGFLSQHDIASSLENKDLTRHFSLGENLSLWSMPSPHEDYREQEKKRRFLNCSGLSGTSKDLNISHSLVSDRSQWV